MKFSDIIAYSIFLGPILFVSGFVWILCTSEILFSTILMVAGLLWTGAALLCWIPIFTEMD